MNQTDAIGRYIVEIDKIYRSGKGTEHSYRPALKTIFEALTSGLTITNEPKHIECGAPDYIITRGSIPLGYIEAKNIPVGIDNKANREQLDRYKQSLNNLIITDYLSFQLFVDGAEVVTATIAKENSGGITPDKKEFVSFVELVNKFTGYEGKTIANSEMLAKTMAAKAKLLADTIEKALNNNDAPHTEDADDTLSGQLEGFRKILIHDLSIPAFADIYAQTLAYGMFAARLNAPPDTMFSRQQAASLILQSNPFLRKFFQYIAGFDLDSRICWIVDALADLFNCVAVGDILLEFGKANQDPYINFYETFLSEYAPGLRESRGVYYTPLPVVKFIVNAVDDILQKEFNMVKGLADNSKIKRSIAQTDGEKKDIEFHKVQILDPAAGTGTFLAEVIDSMYKRFASQKGMWSAYCAEHLIPRLNGFEILMAPYAMAHFKLDMKLKETGFQNTANHRLRVFLTNSLEKPESIASKLPMVEWLTSEANEANRIKRDTPVMVVLGNPPYSVSSQNKSEWIQNLIEDYKKGLNEKKLNLDDDYIKFIRYGQYFIEKNSGGILAFISNNSFIDGVTHRQMRKTLLNTFDKIYILNLHGNSRKKEIIPGCGRDENVFDIQQGVSINICVKTSSKKTR
jgi:type I restriction-modification system DNA methylase subunit